MSCIRLSIISILLVFIVSSLFLLSESGYLEQHVKAVPLQPSKGTVGLDVVNDDESLIPHLIHQTGVTYDPSYKIWLEQSPDWKYHFYSDHVAAQFVQQHMPSEVYQAYQSLPAPVLKADLFRYVVIFVQGGVYADTDVEPLLPLSTWPELQQADIKLVVGIEDDRRVNPGAGTQLDLQLVQWTFAAAPGHPAIKRAIDRIVETTPDNLLTFRRTNVHLDDMIIAWTGPTVFTEIVLDYLQSQQAEDPSAALLGIETPIRIGDALMLPRKAFSNLGNERFDPVARVKHHFAGTWKPSFWEKLWRFISRPFM